MSNLIVNIQGIDFEKSNITFVDGLTMEKVKISYNWLLNAKVKDVIIGEKDNKIVWYFGDWLCGEWKDGIWYSGNFYSGQWNTGEWYSYKLNKFNIINEDLIIEEIDDQYSQFHNGLWKSGEWNGGTFGVNNEEDWENFELFTDENSDYDIDVSNYRKLTGGTYIEKSLAIWYNGNWNDGVMYDAIWNHGQFNDGTINNSKWVDGKFFYGTFNGDTWHDGDWFNGEFIKGDWLTGTFTQLKKDKISYFGNTEINTGATICKWYDGEWKNGEFFSGYQEIDGEKYSINNKISIWYNGTWRNGTWWGGNFRNGNWMNGIWKTGIFGTLFETDWVNPDYLYEYSSTGNYWSGGTITIDASTGLSSTIYDETVNYELKNIKQKYYPDIVSGATSDQVYIYNSDFKYDPNMNNLVHYWRMSDVIDDITGLELSGGGATQFEQYGIIHKSHYFKSHYFNTTISEEYTSGMTITMMVKLTESSDKILIFGDDTTKGLIIGINSYNEVYVDFNGVYMTFGSKLTLNKWYLLSIIFDEEYIILYTDLNMSSEILFTFPTITFIDWYIGGNITISSNYLYMEDIRIYNSILNEDDILLLNARKGVHYSDTKNNYEYEFTNDYELKIDDTIYTLVSAATYNSVKRTGILPYYNIGATLLTLDSAISLTTGSTVELIVNEPVNYEANNGANRTTWRYDQSQIFENYLTFYGTLESQFAEDYVFILNSKTSLKIIASGYDISLSKYYISVYNEDFVKSDSGEIVDLSYSYRYNINKTTYNSIIEKTKYIDNVKVYTDTFEPYFLTGATINYPDTDWVYAGEIIHISNMSEYDGYYNVSGVTIENSAITSILLNTDLNLTPLETYLWSNEAKITNVSRQTYILDDGFLCHGFDNLSVDTNTASTLVKGYKIKIDREIDKQYTIYGDYYERNISLPFKNLELSGVSPLSYGDDYPYYDDKYHIDNHYVDGKKSVSEILQSETYTYGDSGDLWILSGLTYYYPAPYNPDDYNTTIYDTVKNNLRIATRYKIFGVIRNYLYVSNIKLKLYYYEANSLIWENGLWENGVWLSGTFDNGEFVSGLWVEGTFNDGIIGAEQNYARQYISTQPTINNTKPKIL